MKVLSPATFNPKEHRGEIFYGPSLTQPDEGYSVRELYERFTTGLPVDGAKTPVWLDGDHDSDDVEKLMSADMVVQAAVSRRVAEDIKRYEQEIDSSVAKSKASKEAAAKEASDRAADEAFARAASKKPKGDASKEGGAQ